MLNENAKKWVAALRSGRFEQGRWKLHFLGNGVAEPDSYCCLGVACVLAIESGIQLDTVDAGGLRRYADPGGQGSINYLPETVQAWLGLSNSQGLYKGENYKVQSLADDNDKRKTFSEIADIIESEPDGLFLKEGADLGNKN
jgi:hypothetical protein